MLIEDCLDVVAHDLTRGLRGPEAHVTHILSWETGFRVLARVSLFFEQKKGWVQLEYRLKDEPIVMTAGLVPQPGLGRRWYFKCPLSIGDKPCGRLAGRLYLAKTKWFGCRYCQSLSYRSEMDKKANRLATSPKALKKALSECKTVADKKALIDAYLLRQAKARRPIS